MLLLYVLPSAPLSNRCCCVSVTATIAPQPESQHQQQQPQPPPPLCFHHIASLDNSNVLVITISDTPLASSTSAKNVHCTQRVEFVICTSPGGTASATARTISESHRSTVAGERRDRRMSMLRAMMLHISFERSRSGVSVPRVSYVCRPECM